jgi:hypothetical protein
MANFELVTAEDVQLMQGLAQRVTAIRPDLVNSDASFGELAWNWGKGHAADGASWPRRLWFSGGDLVAWGWAQLPRQVRRSDGSVKDITGAYLAYQVHPAHAGLVDEVIDWYDATAADIERTVLPGVADEFALKRWAAHGYETDPAALGDTGSWTQLNERDLADVEQPVLPDGFRFRTAGEAGPEAAVQAHLDAWAPVAYTAESYQGVRQTTAYRGDLHILVEAPDGTMASSTILCSTKRTRPRSSSRSGRIRATGVWGWEGRCFCTGCIWLGQPGPFIRRSPAWVRPGILRHAGCTTASGSGSCRGTRRSSKPSPRAEAWSLVKLQRYGVSGGIRWAAAGSP